ncbi:hypothetical protein L1987_64674 [Smallanthus sonchifolius]|uniref:Uncharacterized protein n=1 Tax=Smallanthus sonchifolius TaxID=185202 RepID=A0ACB9BS74_9ASTR|nr:hypothetical protein L1987_64674 [Smallanthus sonchifolius]
MGIATWAQDSIKAGRVHDIVDSNMKGEISSKCLKLFARIAERCLDNHPNNRPNMDEVVRSLENVLTLQERTGDSLQAAGKTIFDRMVDKFSFTYNGQNSVWIPHAQEAPNSHLLCLPHDQEQEETYA